MVKNYVLLILIIILCIGIVSCPDASNSTTPPSEPSIDLPENYAIYNVTPGWQLINDSDGNLWTNNSNGIAMYNYSTNQWTEYTTEDIDMKSNSAGPLLVDGDDVWIGYGWENNPDGLGVTRWNKATDQTTHFGSYMNTANMPYGPVWEISKHPQTGNIWIGTRFEYASSYFDGSDWNSFQIEDGAIWSPGSAYYFDCNDIQFAGDLGFFESYRGGLHIYDFSSDEWQHSAYGAENGTESFLRRGYWNNCLLIASENEFYLATTNNLATEVSNPPDGIWMYKTSSLSNISPADYQQGKEIYNLISDSQGNLWAYFTQDYSIRKWDGISWTTWEPEDIPFSSNYNIRPLLFDNDYFWVELHVTSNGVSSNRIARYPISKM